jgi:hypothetical protein
MKRKEENRSVIEPSCTFFKPNKINCLPSNRVLDRKPDRVIGYKVLIDLTSLIYTVVCTSLQFIIKHIIYARCIDTVVCTSLQCIIKHIIFFPSSVSILNYKNIAHFFTLPWPLGLCSHDNAIYLFHTNNFNKYLNNFNKLLKMSNSSKNKT